MEETIGYEALFSAEEWDAIQSGDSSGAPPDGWGEPEEARVAAALDEKLRLQDRLTMLWRRATYPILSRFGLRTAKPPWLLPGAPELSEDKARHKTRLFDPPGQYEGDEVEKWTVTI